LIHRMNICQRQKSVSISINIFLCQILIANIALAKRVNSVAEKLVDDFILGWDNRNYNGTEGLVTFFGIDMGC